jgi:anti-sigma regulatory factor (Ser/Thr protein kinase)
MGDSFLTPQRDPAEFVVSADPGAVSGARRFVTEQCRALHVADDTCDTVVLLASETVTNAITHGRSEARVRVSLRRRAVRVEVADENSRHPQTQSPDADALDGRGLSIIAMLAARWGVRDEPYGKTVWFEVATD